MSDRPSHQLVARAATAFRSISGRFKSLSIDRAALALAVSCAALWISARGCYNTERINRLNVEPSLICILDNDPEFPKYLAFTLKNEETLPASNVTVDHYTLRYSKSERTIRLSGASLGPTYQYNLPGHRWIFKDVLRPNDVVRERTGSFVFRDDPDYIGVLLFNVSYTRESDGRVFENECRYYVDGPAIFRPDDFREHPHYKDVIEETDRVLQKDNLFGRDIGLPGARQSPEPK